MIKKLAISAASAAAMLSLTTPAFAANIPSLSVNKITIKNQAQVANQVSTSSNTGGNSINGKVLVSNGVILTGNALGQSQVDNQVNTNSVNSCSCLGPQAISVSNSANVVNHVSTTANTGGNSINAGLAVQGGAISSGDAGASSAVSNVVNTNLVGGGSL